MADICVPPDCLNGYDCYWLFFLSMYRHQYKGSHTIFMSAIQSTTMTICTTYCYIAVVYTVIQLLLLYISLYLQYIWYRFSYLCKSILLFGEMTKLVLTVVYTVIYTISCYIYCYISLSYVIYIIIETLFTPLSQLSYI